MKYLIISILLLSSCKTNRENEQDKLFKRDGKIILNEISQMIKNDQDLRNYFQLGTTDTNVVNKYYAEESFLVDPDTNVIPKHQQDSIIKLMSELQTKHTVRLIEIISKYGYPSSSRLGDTNKNIDPFIVLHHLDIKFKDTLLSLFKNELKHSRIDSSTFEMFRWDLDDRGGIPNIKGMTILKMDSLTGKLDTIIQ
jgi:hypothetical protein